MTIPSQIAVVVLMSLTADSSLRGQSSSDGTLDPIRNVEPSTQAAHKPLPEEYIWTAGGVTAPTNRSQPHIEQHFFRTQFHIDNVPSVATFYIAGPRKADVYLNGHLIGNFSSNPDAPINFHVFHTEAAHALHAGDNVLAIAAVRGRGVVAGAGPAATQQLAYGEVMVAKIVPAPFGTEALPLVITDEQWRSTAIRAEHWEEPNFDDRAWPTAASLGPIEGNIDLFQWNADAGMYGWPGYMGMSPWLRTYLLLPHTISHVYAGRSEITHIESLKDADSGQTKFTVSFPRQPLEAEAPTLLLDFGHEVAGRLLIESECDCVSTLAIAYGESEIEAMSTGFTSGQQGGNYLGTNLIDVPVRGTARGPKSAFRFVRISFLRGASLTVFRSIAVEGIYTPIQYLGFFESSDPVLNHIWETGAYTAHLCMQDDVWDAPKRDRGRWVGDLDIEGRTILTAFGDPSLIKDTLDRLAESTPLGEHVNSIPGYSALWVTSLEYLYLHTQDAAYLASQRNHLINILTAMDESLDANGLFTNPRHQWLFVDWSPGLYGYTPEAVTGTRMQYIRAYRSAASLFAALDDDADSKKYLAQCQRVQSTTIAASLDHSTGTFGSGWQLNALAQLYLSDPAVDKLAIKRHILSHIKQDSPSDPVISPYFNAYLLYAMADAGLTREALDWMRQYWGGMLAEGATSFWESYDLRWPKNNYHLSLQADGTSGYFVSLAHGWSSGPTAFLSEKILGVEPGMHGDNNYSISPNLAGLSQVRGTVPTPQGPIKVSLIKDGPTNVDIPAGIVADVSVQLPWPNAKVYVNGAVATLVTSDPLSQGKSIVQLDNPGHYEITTR